MSSKMKKCKVCGNEIAASAKKCPQCGAKNVKPIYKKWWFWIIAVVVVVIIASGNNSDNKSGKEVSSIATNNTETQQETQEEAIEYTLVDVTDLFDALNENALKAENTYKGKYLEISGYISVIDSDGKYISVGAISTDYNYMLQLVRCDLKKDSGQLEQVMELKKDDKITVRGKIKDVGEVIGYTLDIDSIN